MEILLYSDDPSLALLLEAATEQPCSVRQVRDEHQLYGAAGDGIEAIVLDNGFARYGAVMCLRLRLNTTLPLLVIAGTPHASERVALLRAGADDVLTAPVAGRELAARLDAKRRRAAG
jgi:DNA-binding response OmpR family regulator